VTVGRQSAETRRASTAAAALSWSAMCLTTADFYRAIENRGTFQCQDLRLGVCP
jgi:hypothetical protein